MGKLDSHWMRKENYRLLALEQRQSSGPRSLRALSKENQQGGFLDQRMDLKDLAQTA